MLIDTLCITSPSFSRNRELVSVARTLANRLVLNDPPTKLEGELLSRFIGDAWAAVIGLEPITESVLVECPRLRALSKYGVGLDNIDFQACERHGVTVLSSTGTNKLSVAEHTLCMLLMLSHNINVTYPLMKAGVWKKEGGVQLSGKKVGILGLGHIGKELVRLLLPFRPTLSYFDIVRQTEFESHNPIEFVEPHQLFGMCDFVTIHASLNETSRRMVSAQLLSVMKPTAFLVNTARSQILDLDCLLQCLSSRRLGGAALDVFDVEPPNDARLASLDNVICTPHIAGNTAEAVFAMGKTALDNLAEFFARESAPSRLP